MEVLHHTKVCIFQGSYLRLAQEKYEGKIIDMSDGNHNISISNSDIKICVLKV